MGVLHQRYEAAMNGSDAEEAAEAARAYRNALLDDCDKMMVSDRPNVDTAAWAAYRQALRDIPETEGFPFNITWPEKPE